MGSTGQEICGFFIFIFYFIFFLKISYIKRDAKKATQGYNTYTLTSNKAKKNLDGPKNNLN